MEVVADHLAGGDVAPEDERHQLQRQAAIGFGPPGLAAGQLQSAGVSMSILSS